MEKSWVREYLNNLDIHKFMGPDRLHQRVLSELAEVFAKLLITISD